MAKERIMVVEDEGVVALQIKEALQGLGYEVPVVALSGEEAVARILETEPDLVLMDIHLKGGLSGIEAAQRIRHRIDVPVVYLTAYSDEETLDDAQLTEPYGYVLKPFEEKGLHAVIQMSLLKHRRTRAAREDGWVTNAVAASMMEAVVICDPKGYVKFANPASESLLGRGKADLLEQRLGEVVRLIDAETKEPLAFPVSLPLLEGKSTLRGNCRLALGEGKEKSVELSASPLRSPEGTLFGVLYVLRETSERERIQGLVQREVEELAKAQRRMFPSRETVIPGVRFDWLFFPTAIGGGDAVGVLRLDDDHVAFYALDVIGQGIVSSLFSLILHVFLSPDPDAGGMLVKKLCEEPRKRILAPAELVSELNRRFYQQEEANPYFTMTYGVLETLTGTLRLVRAGHPFPLLQKAGGAVQMVRPEGYAVGLFPSSDVASEQLRFEPGDRLFLYSDGLVDCTNPAGTRFSSARLVDLVKTGSKAPLADLMETMRRELVAWRGSESFADDVSLLALERD